MGITSTREEYEINNIVNYLRKSRKDEEREKRTGEDTLEEQKSLMEKVLSNYEVPYDQYEEIGSGDTIEGRPVFQEVIEEIKKGKYDAIAVKEISRLGRGNYTDAGKIFDLLEEQRMYIITPYKIYDIRNSSDARQVRFEMFFAREEYEQIKERMVGARYNYAMQGKYMTGSVPFGYKNNKNTQRLEVIEEEAKIVRLVFDFYVNGINNRQVGFRAISNQLKKLGIKSPRGADVWDAQTLKRLVNNPVYIGTLRFRQTERRKGKVIQRPENEHIIVEDSHEPIIDKEIFYQAQERIKNPTRKPNTSKIKVSELSALMTCSNCGRKLVINRSKRKYQHKNGEDESVYYDYFLRCRQGCLTTRYEHVERKVFGLLEYFKALDAETLATSFREVVTKEQSDDNPTGQRTEQLLEHINKKKDELEKRRSFIFNKYESGVYDDSTFMERRNAIESELEELAITENELLSDGNESAASKEEPINVDLLRENISYVIDIYDQLSVKGKNEILLRLFSHIEVEVTEKGNNQRPAKLKLRPFVKEDILNEHFNVKPEK